MYRFPRIPLKTFSLAQGRMEVGRSGYKNAFHPFPLGKGAKREPDRAKPQKGEGLKSAEDL